MDRVDIDLIWQHDTIKLLLAVLLTTKQLRCRLRYSHTSELGHVAFRGGLSTSCSYVQDNGG